MGCRISLHKIMHRYDRFRAEWRYKRAGGEPVASAEMSAGLALEWLCRAQNVTDTGGFARAFSLTSGWHLPYPETTGYIIPTLLTYHDRFPLLKLKERAYAAAEWLSSIQFESGAICRKQYYPGNKVPSVFNTGMALHGWVSAAEGGAERALRSAVKAGDWLAAEQESDGSWVRAAFNGIPHTYYTMVDWALLRLFSLTGIERYRDTATRHLDWVLGMQRENGWFENCYFSPDDPVTTHTLSYTTQGLLESGKLLDDDRYIEAARRGTLPLLTSFGKEGTLSGTFDQEWKPTAKWECLTGNAQTALVFHGLSSILSDSTLSRYAEMLIARIMACQKRDARIAGINGAISGSWPINGNYDRFNFPNHAAKFYLDALYEIHKHSLLNHCLKLTK